jgi:hypothetical protein
VEYVLPCLPISRRFRHFVLRANPKFAQTVRFSIGYPSVGFENVRMQLPVVVSWVLLEVGL